MPVAPCVVNNVLYVTDIPYKFFFGVVGTDFGDIRA